MVVMRTVEVVLLLTLDEAGEATLREGDVLVPGAEYRDACKRGIKKHLRENQIAILTIGGV